MRHFCFLTGLYTRYDVLIFERQGQALVNAGYKVTYVVCDNLPNESINGIEIISTEYVPQNRLKRFLNTKKKLLKEAKEVNANIYQISDPELVYLGVKLKKLGKRVVFNMRENYPDMMLQKSYLPKFYRKVFSIFIEEYMKTWLKKYDVVFSVTPIIVDLVSKQWGIKNSYLLTNYPIVNPNFRLSLEDYLKRDNVLCYIGTVYSESRQEMVIEALEKIQNVQYLIAGIFNEPQYNEKIRNHPYWNKVKFINGFRKSELPDIFSNVTISNVLRDFGGKDGSLGIIKIFESMEAALPIIISNVPMYREMIKKYHCGICVNPNNADEIQQAIQYLIENKNIAYQMGQNGRKAVIKEYNWDSQAKTYVEALNKLTIDC